MPLTAVCWGGMHACPGCCLLGRDAGMSLAAGVGCRHVLDCPGGMQACPRLLGRDASMPSTAGNKSGHRSTNADPCAWRDSQHADTAGHACREDEAAEVTIQSASGTERWCVTFPRQHAALAGRGRSHRLSAVRSRAASAPCAAGLPPGVAAAAGTGGSARGAARHGMCAG